MEELVDYHHPEDLKNYRPITLLPTIYKVFTKLLTNRMTRQLDEQQPREQADFRSGFSTIDHLQVVNQVLERTRKCKIPLCMIFVDYDKAFDFIEINAIANALIQQNIPKKYIRTLLNINTNCSTSIRLYHNDIVIPINRGVRQGDPISPKLFTATLEDMFRKLNWENQGWWAAQPSPFRRRHRSLRLRRAIRDRNAQRTQRSKHSSRSSNQSGQNPSDEEWPLCYGNDYPGWSHHFVRWQIHISRPNYYAKSRNRRRRSAARLSFKNVEDVLKKTKDVKLRAHIFNSMILSVLNYGCEVWTLRENGKQKLQTTQREQWNDGYWASN